MTKRMPLKKWSKFWERITLWEQNYEKGSKELCQCSCWKIKFVARTHLVSWVSTMCVNCANRKRNIKHWFAKHNNHDRIYKIYIWIRDRCNREKSWEYHRYWWRWIKCLWNTFEDFKNDMLESYEEHCKNYWVKQTTIDRIDNDWNYCKDNCRRATYKEQAKDNYLKKRTLFNKLKW